MSFKKLFNLIQEIQLQGKRELATRLLFEFNKRSGFDKIFHPVKDISDHDFLKQWHNAKPDNLENIPYWWIKNKSQLFLEKDEEDKKAIRSLVKDAKGKIIERANNAKQGSIWAFRSHYFEFGEPIVWNLNPLNHQFWPETHSSQILNHKKTKNTGDIKLTWEIGRFLHVTDFIRAYIVTNDVTYSEAFFDQVIHFNCSNPLFQGVHWVSEQEVAIRSLMILWGLYTFSSLKSKSYDIITTLKLLYKHAIYLQKKSNLARYCIFNNHILASATALYILGYYLKWLKPSKNWHSLGRTLLFEAFEKQWLADGGYIQPSHNYHRLSLSYLLWVTRVAQDKEDIELLNRLIPILKKGNKSLLAFINERNGRLPNWGPNDGSLFPPYTECEYHDFRPVLQTINYLIYNKRLFPRGIWDESLVWYVNSNALNTKKENSTTLNNHTPIFFPQWGMASLRCDQNNFATMRWGSVYSRFGQQSDMLHVDIWKEGSNIACDPGSFSYHNKNDHEWFRSTPAHNTIVVNNTNQMIAHRQFKFLRWTKAKMEKIPRTKLLLQGLLGYHHGYTRFQEKIWHARLLAETYSHGWIIVDHVWAEKPQLSSDGFKVDLHWLLSTGWQEIDGNADSLLLIKKTFTCQLSWCSTIPIKKKLVCGQKAPQIDGWYAASYAIKQAVPSLHLNAQVSKSIFIVSYFSYEQKKQSMKIERDNKNLTLTINANSYDLSQLANLTPQL